MQLTLDGSPIFGTVLKFRHNPSATSQQINAFFGVTGTQAVFGGGRGRAFEVDGLLIAETIAAIRALETMIETYADGAARTLLATYADGSSYAWSGVVYKGQYQPQGDPRPEVSTGFYVQPYRLVLLGLV